MYMCIYTHTLLITFMLFKKLLLHSLYISFLQREMLNLCFLHKFPPFPKEIFWIRSAKLDSVLQQSRVWKVILSLKAPFFSNLI